jgi:hypothetical protein
MLHRVVWLVLTVVSEELSVSIALMMEAVSSSETSVNIYQTTRRDFPEDSHLHTRRRENLKSHLIYTVIVRGKTKLIFRQFTVS